jgi:hypothetical protein
MTVVSPIGRGLAASLIANLRGHYSAASALARLTRQTNGLIDERSVSCESKAQLELITGDFISRRWLVRDGSGWRLGDVEIPMGVSTFLEGAAAHEETIVDGGVTRSAVTMPAAPSAIAAALPRTGLIHSHLISTEEAFTLVAERSETTFVIMTPFLNDPGVRRAAAIFQASKAQKRLLITRYTGDTARSLAGAASLLAQADVQALNYSIQGADGYESFHAKVALADDALAYVGSANMTVYDRHSMELGVMMEGHPARVIASVVRAVTEIASPIPLSTTNV